MKTAGRLPIGLRDTMLTARATARLRLPLAKAWDSACKVYHKFSGAWPPFECSAFCSATANSLTKRWLSPIAAVT